MSVAHIISRICNSRIGEVILIGDNTTMLDYIHQFMGSLHAINSRSRTPTSLDCYKHRVLECS